MFLRFDSDSSAIIFDTGASLSISNDKNDFVELEPYSANVSGLGDMNIKGKGTIKWRILDDHGEEWTIMAKNSYYAPDLRAKLFSPQQFCAQFGPKVDTYFKGDGKHFFMKWKHNSLTLPYCKHTNLPIAYTMPSAKNFLCHLEKSDNSKNDSPYVDIQNDACKETMKYKESISGSQKKMLNWHYRLGHMSFKRMQELARNGILPKCLATCDFPVCSDCQYGRQARRSANDKALDGSIDCEKPGDFLHLDQAISSTPGRLLTPSGRPSKKQCTAVTLMVDTVSKKIFAGFQQSTNAEETIQFKTEVEREAMSCNVRLRTFRADNGVFKSKAFHDNVNSLGQKITFCGVGAHNQNGVAERYIRTVFEKARTLLLHAHARWPKVSFDLWPFAVC